MTDINRTVLVPHPAKALFDLVLDVKAYPEFLPWCGGASVSEQSDRHQIASVKIAKGMINTEFTTHNTLIRDKEIIIKLVSGPFRNLDGAWRFHALSDHACKVELDMKFDFSAGPVGIVLKPVFTHICTTLLNAFVERAKVVYPAVGPGLDADEN